MPDQPFIELKNIYFSYNHDAPILKDVSYCFKKGALYLIKGRSGVGKTSLLRLLARLEEPIRGEMLFKEKRYSQYDPPELRQKIIYIHQTPIAMDGSVEENLLFPFAFKSNQNKKKPDDERLQSYLKDFMLNDVQLDKNAQNLSVGQLQRLSFIRLPVFFSMFISFSFVSFIVTAAVVQVKPWWTPQYFIPLGGMVIGNSMNAIAIALERLLGELRSKRKEIEMKLCHGADFKEASDNALGEAMKAGMIPSINSMMAVGIVFIPGMMTGQILAGSDPVMAIKYQIIIMIMIMIVGATAIGTLITVSVIRNRCFSHGQQLILN